MQQLFSEVTSVVSVECCMSAKCFHFLINIQFRVLTSFVTWVFNMVRYNHYAINVLVVNY